MITDPNEYIPFSDFADTGVLTADTFNIWRQKDNGLVQHFNQFEFNSALSGIIVDNANAIITIRAGGVVASNLATNAVTTDKILNLNVTEPKIGTDAVTESKIKIDSVTTNKIKNLNVTEAKIASNAITTAKIALNAITTAKIALSAVTADKIASNAITTDKIALSAVTADKIANSSSTTNGVTYAKLQYMKNLSVIGNVSGGTNSPTEVDVLDDAVMAANSATALASQKSIKGYVDASVNKFNEFLPVAKAYCTIAGGILTVKSNSGFASIVRTSGGVFTATLNKALNNANYIVLITKESRPLEGDITVGIGTKTTTSFRIDNVNDNATYADPNGFHLVVIP